jgi:hypothetical protein
VVVDDLDVMGVTTDPAEANAKLVVDADAVLAEAIAGQFLQSVSRWHFQVSEGDCGVEHDELAEGNTLEIRRESADLLALEKSLGVVVAKAANHET